MADMQSLSQAECLALWERGRVLHPLDRGLLAVHTAFPESRGESIADWPLGRRNRALAAVRCATFGRMLRGWAACEHCGEKLEFAVDGFALVDGGEPSFEQPVAYEQWQFRLPTSRDLAAIASEPNADAAAVRLLEQCLLHPSGPEAFRAGWDADALEAIGARIAEADPLAEILLHFDCPACGSSFDEALDLASFLWIELEGRAKRLLLDVHLLASAYGWSEAEILNLSAARRNLYLEMVRV